MLISEITLDGLEAHFSLPLIFIDWYFPSMDSVSPQMPPEAMLPFSVMTRLWFPLMLAAVIAATGLTGRLWALLPTAVLWIGFRLQLRELELSPGEALSRPANQATLIRLLSVLAGLLVLSVSAVPNWIPLTLICGGLALDFVDGFLARRIPSKEGARVFGAWMDRESDALALFLIGRSLHHHSAGLHPILILGAARYLFGLLFLIIPLPLPQDKRFSTLSRTIAALAQFAAGAALFPLAAPELTVRIPLASWLIPRFAWTAAGLVLFSFCWETLLRARTFQEAAGRHWRGLLRSFLVYYRLPFRYRRIRHLYADLVPPGGIAFDIGSHLGNRIPPLLAKAGRVVAVEPQPGCTELLSLWYGRRPQVELVFAALGASPGRTPLYVCGEHPTLTSLAPDWLEQAATDPLFSGVSWKEEGSTEVITLAELRRIYGEPDFVKIDVEGFEKEVVAGAGEPLRALSFEFLPAAASTSAGVIELLEKAGSYRYNFSWGETMRYIFPDWLSADELYRFLDDAQRGKRSGDIYARLAEA